MTHSFSPQRTGRPLAIGELADRTGASRRSIRHYEAQGLLDSIRADNGYRYYNVAAVARVSQIQQFISAGFSLEEIRTFPECMLALEGTTPCPETLAAHRHRLASLEEQITGLRRRQAVLRMLLRHSEGSPPTTASD